MENGTRTVYEVRWDKSGDFKGRLTFRRSVYDGDMIYSHVVYMVDGDEYRLVEAKIAENEIAWQDKQHK